MHAQVIVDMLQVQISQEGLRMSGSHGIYKATGAQFPKIINSVTI